MSTQLIAVQKVVRGEDRSIKLEPELIRFDEIKSIRPWKKNTKEENSIKEDFLLIYMHGKNREGKEPTVKIAESLEHFEKRTNAIKLRIQESNAEQQHNTTQA